MDLWIKLIVFHPVDPELFVQVVEPLGFCLLTFKIVALGLRQSQLILSIMDSLPHVIVLIYEVQPLFPEDHVALAFHHLHALFGFGLCHDLVVLHAQSKRDVDLVQSFHELFPFKGNQAKLADQIRWSELPHLLPREVVPDLRCQINRVDPQVLLQLLI